MFKPRLGFKVEMIPSSLKGKIKINAIRMNKNYYIFLHNLDKIWCQHFYKIYKRIFSQTYVRCNKLKHFTIVEKYKNMENCWSRFR